MTTSQPLHHAHALLSQITGPAAGGENPDDPATVWAMPIIVQIDKREPPRREALLAASATAVVACCLDPRVGVDEVYTRHVVGWYSARMRKVTRRAKPGAAWEKTLGIPGVTATCDGAHARALIPYTLADTPQCVSRLQVSGTDVPAGPQPDPREDIPRILLDRGLGMTAGKACAQAGHAAMLLAAQMGIDELSRWQEQGFACEVREVDTDAFWRAAARDDVVRIVDAGFTEIPPGSVTAVAAPARCGDR